MRGREGRRTNEEARRALELQFETIQVGSKVLRTFRLSQYTKAHYIYDQTDTRVAQRRPQGCARRGRRRGTAHRQQAAPNELNLERVGKAMRAGHRQGGGVGGCSSGLV